MLAHLVQRVLQLCIRHSHSSRLLVDGRVSTCHVCWVPVLQVMELLGVEKLEGVPAAVNRVSGTALRQGCRIGLQREKLCVLAVMSAMHRVFCSFLHVNTRDWMAHQEDQRCEQLRWCM